MKRILAISLLAVGVAAISPAATNTWKGAANGDWFLPSNWSTNGVPTDGDDVVVTNTSILLTNSTATLGSFTITNATLTFTNWTTALNATNVVIRNLGKLTHVACNTNGAPDNTNRVYVLCSNLTIEVGGSVNANGMGYAGGVANGRGQGSGGGYPAQDGGGGGYGGQGGYSWSYAAAGGPVYSAADDASEPGSAGGWCTRTGSSGGAGGGAVHLDLTGALTLRGSIMANGASGVHAGSGSGGGIVVDCDTFNASTGSSIVADGATCTPGGYGGGGGGGRIKLSCAQVTPGSAVYLSADNGTKAPGGGGYDGSIGSVHVSSADLLPETGRFNGSICGITTWAPSHLSYTNSHVGLGAPDFALTVSNDFTLSQASTLSAYLSNSTLRVDGNFILTNSAVVTLRSGPTNAAGAWTNCGGRLSVGGMLYVGANCTNILVPVRDDTGAIRCDVGQLTVASNGVVHADYLGHYGGATVNTAGSGPGGGAYGSYGAGGGHGGKGGNSASGATGGGPYGNSNAPTRCGSGGGSTTSGSWLRGGNGGGVVWVESPGTIRVDGRLSARGEPANNHCGCGAGGSIYLAADTFAGAGALDARGGSVGDGVNNTHGGGGGGGRIAVGYRTDTYTGTITANGGVGNFGQSGTNGTVVRTMLPGYVTLTVVGSPASRDAPVPYYGDNGCLLGAMVTNTVTSPADQAAGVRYECLGWATTNGAGTFTSGPGTQTAVEMTTNTTLTWYWTNVYELVSSAAANGSLQDDRSGWYTNATEVTVTAVPAPECHFVQWSGDWPAGSWTNNPLTVTMNQPRTLIAHFASNAPGTKTWSGTGNWYSDYANWTPPGAPGTGDAAVVASGTATLLDPVSVNALTITNESVKVLGRRAGDMSVAGDLTIRNAGASLWVSNAVVTVGGSLILTNSSKLYAHAGVASVTNEYGALVTVGQSLSIGAGCTNYVYSHPTNGGSCLWRVGRFVLDGTFSADGGGCAGGTSTHTTGYGFSGAKPGGAGPYGAGAGYGGIGGDALGTITTHGMDYGSLTQPLWPGSGGARGYNIDGSRGGGLVWLESAGPVILNGRISADGADAPVHGGAGSGGGIYLRCSTLRGNANGWLSAVGGTVGSGSGGGGGGGGRIAVLCAARSWAYTNQVTVDGGSNVVYSASNYQGRVGTIYWGFTGSLGTVFVVK